jgi:hypothetical protein
MKYQIRSIFLKERRGTMKKWIKTHKTKIMIGSIITTILIIGVGIIVISSDSDICDGSSDTYDKI